MTATNMSKKQMTQKDIYLMAIAEDSLKDNVDKYPIDKWYIINSGVSDVEEHFNNLSLSDQEELENRLTAFVPKISDLCDELGDKPFSEEKAEIVKEIVNMVVDEFSDFIMDGATE